MKLYFLYLLKSDIIIFETGRGDFLIHEEAVFGALLITLVVCIWILIRDNKVRKIILASGLSLKDESQFIMQIAQLFENLQYEVNRKQRYLLIEKNEQKILVVPRLSNKLIKPQLVKDVMAARGQYKANKAIIITNFRFNWVAKDLASMSKVELWNGNKLCKELLVTKNKKKTDI